MLVGADRGWLSGSLALLADAAHMFADVAALGLALVAAWIAQRPATPEPVVRVPAPRDSRRPHQWRGVVRHRDRHRSRGMAPAPGLPDREWTLAPRRRGGRFVANLGAVIILHRGHEHSLNQRGAYLHVLGDLLGSVGALIAGVIVITSGWVLADPLISVLIGGLVLISAWRLVKESTDVLLEAAPRHIALSDVHDRIASVPGVESVHDLHLWTVTSGVVAMSGHLVVKNPIDNQPVLEPCRTGCGYLDRPCDGAGRAEPTCD